MGALLEEFRIAEFLDVFFGELVILDEGFAGFVGEDLAIGAHEVLGQNAADQAVIGAELGAVLKAASAAEVITLVIEELLNEEIDDAVLGDRLARL
jgi:hypothetical protein